MRNLSPHRAWLLASLLLSLPAGLAACGSSDTSTDTPSPAAGSGGAGAAGKAGAAGTSGASGASAGSGGIGGISSLGGAAGAGGDAGTGGSAGSAGSAGSGGVTAICQPDEDNDEISDEVEGKETNLDTDGDTIPDYLDNDSDGDSIPDQMEGFTKFNGCASPQDSDGDKIPDFQDTDSDNNGLPDAQEIYPSGESYTEGNPPADTNGDKAPDYADPDNDGDTLLDTVELVDGKAVDTDGDGLPDLDDPDSDNDTIADGQEGTADPDGDGKPSFRDDDSDGDGISDQCEAGFQHKLGTPPVDTDNDGKYDFVDLDSDADGIPDAEEDKNGNCEVDAGETDPRLADTDEDGVNDLIEIALGSDPLNKFSTPGSLGKLFFVLPYNDVPQPETGVLGLKLGLQKADVAFVMDTTGTMGQELQGLRDGVADLSTQIKKLLPDTQFGVAAHDDYPVLPYGEGNKGDQAFYVPTGGQVTSDLTKTQQALNALTTHSGGVDDTAESQVLAMWAALTSKPYQYPGMLVDAPSVPTGRFGALGFRKDALPILIPITDGAFHNGRRASAPGSLHDLYTFNNQSPYPAPTVDTLVEEMTTVGAKMLGISSSDGKRNGNDPYEDMAYLADQTGSLVPLKAFGGTCNTSLGGNALLTPDGPDNKCRLIFDIPTASGVGLTQRIVDGVKALLKSLVYDVRVVAIPDDPANNPQGLDSVDTFIESIEVASGAVDPNNPGVACLVVAQGTQTLDQWQGPKGLAFVPDGKFETVKGAEADVKICYKVKPIPNTTIQQAEKVQVFKAVLQVRAKAGKTSQELDFGLPRDIIFVIPPKPQ